MVNNEILNSVFVVGNGVVLMLLSVLSGDIVLNSNNVFVLIIL